jgi:hypothetical protein
MPICGVTATDAVGPLSLTTGGRHQSGFGELGLSRRIHGQSQLQMWSCSRQPPKPGAEVRCRGAGKQPTSSNFMECARSLMSLDCCCARGCSAVLGRTKSSSRTVCVSRGFSRLDRRCHGARDQRRQPHHPGLLRPESRSSAGAKTGWKAERSPRVVHNGTTGLLRSLTGLLRRRMTTNQRVMDIIPWTLVSILIESQIDFLIVLKHKSPSGRQLSIRADSRRFRS